MLFIVISRGEWKSVCERPQFPPKCYEYLRLITVVFSNKIQNVNVSFNLWVYLRILPGRWSLVSVLSPPSLKMRADVCLISAYEFVERFCITFSAVLVNRFMQFLPREQICWRSISCRNSGCLSVTHVLQQNQTMHWGYFDNTRKGNHSSLLTPTVVGGRRPFLSEICAESDPALRNTSTSTDFCL